MPSGAVRAFTAADDRRGARFDGTDPTGARLHDVDLTGARITGADLVGPDISGGDDVRINGVDVGPLIEAELDRRHPERRRIPTGPG